MEHLQYSFFAAVPMIFYFDAESLWPAAIGEKPTQTTSPQLTFELVVHLMSPNPAPQLWRKQPFRLFG
jgi:hypothetical protein